MAKAYADFYQWANRSPDLNQIFAATLFIYERMPGYDGEVRDRIIRFWSGEKIELAEIKKWLKDCGESSNF